MLHGYVDTSVIVHLEHVHAVFVKLIALYNFLHYLSHNFFLSNFYLLNLVFDASSHRIILKTVLLRPKAIFAKHNAKLRPNIVRANNFMRNWCFYAIYLTHINQVDLHQCQITAI